MQTLHRLQRLPVLLAEHIDPATVRALLAVAVAEQWLHLHHVLGAVVIDLTHAHDMAVVAPLVQAELEPERDYPDPVKQALPEARHQDAAPCTTSMNQSGAGSHSG